MNAGRPLRFEHLVEVNDPEQPELGHLSRAQLQRGLRLRMEHPQAFQPGLDGCQVSWQADGSLRRALVFSGREIVDRVRFEADGALECVVSGSEGHFSLRIAIEEPGPGHLFLRFIYTASSPDHQAGSPYGETVRQAWQRADEDTVFRLRQLARSGGLDA